MLDNIPDIDLIAFYKSEYFKEWNMACKNGVKLTAKDIRCRLGIK